GGVRGAQRRHVSHRLAQVEQLLVKTAEAAQRVDQMDFENPVASPTAGGGAGDLLVREFPDQMACDVAAPAEPLRTGGLDGGVEQVRAGDVGVVLEIVTTGLPHPGQSIA